MQVRIGYEIILTLHIPTTIVGLLHTYPRQYQLTRPENLQIEPFTSHKLFIDSFGNRCMRTFAPSGQLSLKNEAIVEIDGTPDKMDWEAIELSQHELPFETLRFLYPSRYCEVERLQDFSWKKFGHFTPGYQRVHAICDWVHRQIEFGYEYASNTKTACDVIREGKGVCRDFTHLAITLCRALGIPARYVTGYLGDIGVPKDPAPMDFSAWFEVYLSTGWYSFDPRHNKRRIGRIIIAYGRDAADVAIVTTFGSHTLEHFAVSTEEIKLPFNLTDLNH